MAIGSTKAMADHSAKRSPSSYERVRDWINRYSSDKQLGPGARIPSERTIAAELGISRPTVTRAIVRLSKEGVLVREERSGTFIDGRSAPRNSVGKPLTTIGIIMPWLSQASGNGAGDIVPASRPSVRSHVPFGKESLSLQVAHGAFAAIKEANCHIVLHSNGTPEEESEALEQLINEGVDGVISMPDFSRRNARGYRALISSGIPVVLIDHYYPDVETDYVVTDNFAATRDAVRQLISQGHKRIAYFADFEDVTSIAEREAGYRAALEEAGIPYDEDIVRGPEMTREHKFAYDLALEHCRSSAEPITAVFCLNDDVLLATMFAASKLSISVPGDLEVAGFYDDVPDVMPTPFTRVVQQKTAIGNAAARILIGRILGTAPAQPEHIVLPAEIVPRG